MLIDDSEGRRRINGADKKAITQSQSVAEGRRYLQKRPLYLYKFPPLPHLTMANLARFFVNIREPNRPNFKLQRLVPARSRDLLKTIFDKRSLWFLKIIFMTKCDRLISRLSELVIYVVFFCFSFSGSFRGNVCTLMMDSALIMQLLKAEFFRCYF